MKIFVTQLTGYLQKIAEKEEMSIEDGARLLAQAIIGEGRILLHGFEEMEAVVVEATKGQEKLPKVERLMQHGRIRDDIDETDCILLITRFSNDEKAIEVATHVKEKGSQIVAISAVVHDEGASLADVADVHIDSKLIKPLIPKDDGTRFGFPAVITALFAYYCLFFTISEILEEYEEI
ncbi:DUF2529 domain-containing protein [Thermaerobacillus caldiproteolyticus]|uniref:Putative phosphosugar-binding protein n=1 Tax=Thermaerobacillus caldiproteolyticus TaxID=247480 RepID=A0A7W0BZT4_9BACL|nr:DUF2529 domain-containing protein [Anoxybacillus caldiproteolyticus]MBA2874449.1 putative phosphosugar-binding protein [Anoxybacillus caldiproteolyticus]QPA30853.1 DUF2529 domain-containing protein [Anoxybacillus caldiproteolyticus]